MKKYIIILLVNFLLLFNFIGINGLNTIKAENNINKYKQNTVCINTYYLLNRIPMYNNIQNKINNIKKNHNLVMKNMVKEMENLIYKFQNAKNNNDRDLIQKKIELLEKRIKNYEKKAFFDINKKKIVLFKPLLKILKKNILKIVNNNKNILRIDDCSAGQNVIFNRGEDITKDVELEIKKK